MRKKEHRNGERYESQPDQEQETTAGDETPRQEGDSLSALKAILSKVAALLKPLLLTPDEATKLVEDLYSSVLARDLQLAGEADDTRKSAVLAYLEHIQVSRQDGRIVIEYPSNESLPAPHKESDTATASPVGIQTSEETTAEPGETAG